MAATILPAEYTFLARCVLFLDDDLVRLAPVLMQLYGDFGERRCPAPCDFLHGVRHVADFLCHRVPEPRLQ